MVDVYSNVVDDPFELERFRKAWNACTLLVGHNLLGWDFNHLRRLTNLSFSSVELRTLDTYILSKLVDYSREDGHSIESYGKEFGFEKLVFTDFSKLSEEMVTYCLRDVEISEKIFHKYKKVINDPKWKQSLDTEHVFQWKAVVNQLQRNGFAFNTEECKILLNSVEKELKVLDNDINEFPPIVIPGREIIPTYTKYGTLHRKDFRFESGGDLSNYNGGSFCRISYGVFNPASPKQVVDTLWSAGWQPEERTKTAILTDREISKLSREKADPQTIEPLLIKQERFKRYGWKISEHNLLTLPDTAPKAARTLARRILVEARRRTLTEWLNLVKDTGRIHGQFQSIGAWTHRMAHQKPNMANIPNHLDLADRVRFLGA
ncbi:MAG TPA: hypothetical protein VEP90_06360, partial [Methylomirabilota bacterium]|nr:hypothetical protein [Methylomirabilota bacterium]